MRKPTKHKAYEAAILAVEGHLLRHAGGMTPKIYDYLGIGDTLKARPFVGVRVAEVSFANERGGCSFMQCDPEGLAVCAAVERCILAFTEGWGQEEIDEELWRLDQMFKPKEEHADRTA